jgi:hypothetical protein
LSGNEELLAACRSVHAYATFCAPVPLQLGIAAALDREVEVARSGNCDVSSASDDSGIGSPCTDVTVKSERVLTAARLLP